MTDCSQVNADLMRSPGTEVDVEEGRLGSESEGCHRRHRMLSPGPHAEGDRAYASQRSVDGLPFRKLTFRQSEISLLKPLPLELPGHRGIDRRELRKEDDSCRAAIQPLHEEAMLAALLKVRRHFLDQDWLSRVMRTLHDDARRLVDKDDRFIFIEDIEHLRRVKREG